MKYYDDYVYNEIKLISSWHTLQPKSIELRQTQIWNIKIKFIF